MFQFVASTSPGVAHAERTLCTAQIDDIFLAKPAACPQDAASLAEVGHTGKVYPNLWQYFPWLNNWPKESDPLMVEG